MDNSKAEEIIYNILGLMGLPSDSYQVTAEDESSFHIQINVPEEEAGAFVGHHGEGLSSLRLIFALVINQRLDLWPKLRLNINDYQERREDSLKNLAENAAEKAVQLKKEIILPRLNSYERRIVHLYLEQTPGITTQSRGEEPYRQLIIIPTDV